MPRAEAGTTKAIANKMKSKGLQRLRWYCQPCEKQCRDENGFKCHTQSESHVRQMMVIGSNSGKVINDYSKEFVSDFLTQLRVSHNTKPVHINHFYQEYIANKEHIHMNSTKWKSLTEFAKHLGQEGVCRVEETEKGLHIAWIDNSPDALRRQEAVRKRERMEKSGEQHEQRLLQQQVKNAHAKARDEEAKRARAAEQAKAGDAPTADAQSPTPPHSGDENSDGTAEAGQKRKADALTPPSEEKGAPEEDNKPLMPISLFSGPVKKNEPPAAKPFNVFAAAKKEKKRKDALAKEKTVVNKEPVKPMSEAERIMRQEMDRKKQFGRLNPPKKQRVG